MKDAGTSLGLALSVTLLIFILQTAGAYLSNSLALLSDSGHVFSDVVSLGISWLAVGLAMKPASLRKTFGWHRAEIFAALINALLLLAMAIVIIYEATLRIYSPPQINTPLMLLFALVGLAGNAFVVFKLRGHENLNVKSAMLHALSDALSSVGVIVGAVVIALTGLAVFDAVASLLIACLMLWGSYRVGKEALRVLFEFSPKGLGAKEICQAIGGVKGVRGVHDVHTWMVCSDFVCLDAHVVVSDRKVSECGKMAKEIEKRLSKIGIAHATIQFETEGHGHGKGMTCEIGH